MWRLVASAALAACYAPVTPAGAPCARDEQCPHAQQCVSGVCGGSGEELLDADAPDASPLDAPSLDARAPDAPQATGCSTTAVCATAPTLPPVSGDTGHAISTASGYQAAWYRIRVTEDNDDPIGRTVRVEARLTLPPEVAFEVVLYANVATDVVECATTIGTAATSANVKQVRAQWGDGVFGNNLNDGRYVSVEIRPVSGACAPDQPWQLAIEGNWN